MEGNWGPQMSPEDKGRVETRRETNREGRKEKTSNDGSYKKLFQEEAVDTQLQESGDMQKCGPNISCIILFRRVSKI